MFKCEICDREFVRKEGLSRHISKTHNKIKKVVKKHACPRCNKLIGRNYYKRHLKQCNFSNDEIFIINESIRWEEIPFIGNLLKRILDLKEIENSWKIVSAFKSFKNIVEYVRLIEEDDINRFFESDMLEWKKKNGAVTNSRELCYIVFFDSDVDAEAAYEVVKSKNYYTGHGSELSPFSKDFIGYKDIKDKKVAVKNLVAKAEDGKEYCNRVEYWTKRGLTEEEAKQKVKERQTTNSVEAIMKQRNCSEEDAIKVRQDITEKWLKSFPKSNFSKISQEIFWKICEQIPDLKFNSNFATNDNGYRNDKVNKEFRVKTKKTFRLLDFYIQNINKAIEFDGDYWHGLEGNKIRDAERTNEILEVMPDLKIFRISECDYNKNPDIIIKECIKWIKN